MSSKLTIKKQIKCTQNYVCISQLLLHSICFKCSSDPLYVASVSVQVDLNFEGKKNVSSLWLRWKNGLIFEINIFCINEKQFEPSTVLIPTSKIRMMFILIKH
jgi:hypothetical protein